MTVLTPWRRKGAFAELAPFDRWMRDFTEYLAQNGKWPVLPEGEIVPPADLAETDKDYQVSIDLPGVEPNDVDVKLFGSELVVAGERRPKKEEKGRHVHRIECSSGTFERRFDLPDDVRKDVKNVEATFHNGVLEIRVPKAEPKPATKIPIKQG